MARNRIWIVAGVLVGIIVVALSWFLGLSPQLDQANAADAQTAITVDKNRVHVAELAALKAKFEKLDDLKKSLASARESIPQSDSFPEILTEMYAVESESGTRIESLTSSDSLPFVAAKDYPNAVPKGLLNNTFVTVKIEMTVTGSLDQLIAFIHNLQFGKRLFLVTDLTLTGATPDSADITGLIYILAPDPSNSTAPSTASPSPSPTPSPTDSPSSPAPSDSSTPSPSNQTTRLN